MYDIQNRQFLRLQKNFMVCTYFEDSVYLLNSVGISVGTGVGCGIGLADSQLSSPLASRKNIHPFDFLLSPCVHSAQLMFL